MPSLCGKVSKRVQAQKNRQLVGAVADWCWKTTEPTYKHADLCLRQHAKLTSAVQTHDETVNTGDAHLVSTLSPVVNLGPTAT